MKLDLARRRHNDGGFQEAVESSTPVELGRHTFSQTDQEWFGMLSGDFNPLHMDPIVARRLITGHPVVHGMHLVLWALDRLGESKRSQDRRIGSLVVRFCRPVSVGDPVEAVILPTGRISIRSELGTAVEIEPIWTEAPESEEKGVVDDIAEVTEPLDPVAGELPNQGGRLGLYIDEKIWRTRYSNCWEILGRNSVAGLLALTRLIGMVCPGRHSLFARFSATFESTGADTFHFSVDRYDDRFESVSLVADAPGMRAVALAFRRVPAQHQPATVALLPLVEPGEFTDWRALVIGGSRGLGEVTAKLVAAGGGHACVTYAQGHGDAERVVTDIEAAGGSATALHWNVLAPLPEMSGVKPFTHLFYFASPRIHFQRSRPFHQERLHEFLEFYVDGFVKTLKAVPRSPNGKLRVFCPSTAFIDDRPSEFAEYIEAKVALETLCAEIGQSDPGIEIICPRLPRLRTDQTAGLKNVEVRDPAPALLSVLREWNS